MDAMAMLTYLLAQYLPSLRGALLSAEARLRAKADATKQSILSLRLDGLLRFIGRAFARPVRSQ
jgi:hypothetical protein